jgi:nucleosome binding factor SPN SPT16 subunit
MDESARLQGALGTFPNDFTEGSAAAEAWIASVRSTGKPLVDATRGIELVFAVKDDEAVLQVTKAGHLVSRMARNVFVKTMEEIIDEDKKTTNAQLADTVENAVDKLDDYKIKVDTEIFDVMVKPVVQSGGTYNVHVAKGDVARYVSGMLIVDLASDEDRSFAAPPRHLLTTPSFSRSV